MVGPSTVASPQSSTSFWLVPSSTHPTNRNVPGLSQSLVLECWWLSNLLSIPMIHFLSVHFWGKVVTSIAPPPPALQSVFQLSSGTACPQAGKLGWARLSWLRHHIPGKRWLPGFLFCPSRRREQHLLLRWITIGMIVGLLRTYASRPIVPPQKKTQSNNPTRP